jgi:hypothetical protein
VKTRHQPTDISVAVDSRESGDEGLDQSVNVLGAVDDRPTCHESHHHPIDERQEAANLYIFRAAARRLSGGSVRRIARWCPWR